jgi:hypothetical protein
MLMAILQFIISTMKSISILDPRGGFLSSFPGPSIIKETNWHRRFFNSDQSSHVRYAANQRRVQWGNEHKTKSDFRCLPSPPLNWTNFASRNLIDLARNIIPTQIVSMPLSGAARPVTLMVSIVQPQQSV